MDTLLDDYERHVIGLLSEAWAKFLELKELHPDDIPEFRHAIHTAQNIVLSRPVLRDQGR